MFPPPRTEPETAGGEAVVPGMAEVFTEEAGEATSVADPFALKIQKARELSESNPKAVANIIEEWMNPNG